MRFSLVVCICLLVGCVPHAYSPPTYILPLESAQALSPRQKSVSASVGQHAEFLFGPDISTGTARFRYGLMEGLELSLDGNLLHINNGEPGVSTNPFIGGLRVGFKYQPICCLAFTGGLGGGYSAGGGFLGPDVGMIISPVSTRMTPFLSFRAGLSMPLTPRDVNFGFDDNGLPDIQSPNPTRYWSIATGLRIPVVHFKRPDKQWLFVLLGIGATRAIDLVSPALDDFLEGRAGLEVTFR